MNRIDEKVILVAMSEFETPVGVQSPVCQILTMEMAHHSPMFWDSVNWSLLMQGRNKPLWKKRYQ
jgi:hypothetical protein